MDDATTEPSLEAVTRAAVTIGRPADELRALWLRPDTQSRIWAHFAELRALDERTAEWVAHGPTGAEHRWRTELTQSASDLRWSSLEGADAANAGVLVFRPAPAERGTELHLEVRFDPPGGAVGEAIGKLFHIIPREIVLKALYNFRALALTGEIPSTEPQPAARDGGVSR